MSVRQHYGEISQSLSRSTTHRGAPLLYTNACSMGTKQDDLDMCVCLKGYDLIGIMEMCWDGSHDWSHLMEEYRLCRKDRLGRQGGVVVLYVNEQLECTELCLGMDEEVTENL